VVGIEVINSGSLTKDHSRKIWQ